MSSASASKPRAPTLRCTIYTRKSSEEGLEQSYNSLDAQREACEAYITSQRSEGWVIDPTRYDDGGYSGGTMQRPALARLLADIEARRISIVVVYKVDRLSRSLSDFVRMVERFEQHGVSFVSVTQQFNTSTSMGRLTLNVLLSFAQFEREVTSERIRDKIAASKRKGMWMGGVVPLGYEVQDRKLVVVPAEAQTVRHIFARYEALGCVRRLKGELDPGGYRSKTGQHFSRGALYRLLTNPLHAGQVAHQGQLHEGEHEAIVAPAVWKRVQTLLAHNRRRKALHTSAKDPSLLAGLLYDDAGNPMSPHHAKKGNRRYRYYVSQAIIQLRESEAGSVTRVPAHSVEDVVVDTLRDLLSDAERLLLQLTTEGLSAPQCQTLVEAAAALATEWEALELQDIIAHLKQMVVRVTVGRERLTVRFSNRGLIGVLLTEGAEPPTPPASSDDGFDIGVPVQLKRCGLETRLCVSSGTGPNPSSATVRALQEALRKGIAWNHALITGNASSTAELAVREGVTAPYVARLIRVAWLAPDIQEAILRGEAPSGLSLERLRGGFPWDWAAQRREFGFS